MAELPPDVGPRFLAWMLRTAEALGIELAGDAIASMDQLFAAAEAAGMLDRVTHADEVTMTGDDGRAVTVRRGEVAFLLSPSGQVVMISVEGPKA